MNKELEALERYGYHCNHYVNGEKDYKIIETALKRLEELKIENSKQFKEKWVQDNLAMTFELNVAKKNLKALEIIKSKGVAVGMLQLEEVGLKEYNDYIGDKKLYLTQEEFNFLKEVLL